MQTGQEGVKNAFLISVFLGKGSRGEWVGGRKANVWLLAVILYVGVTRQGEGVLELGRPASWDGGRWPDSILDSCRGRVVLTRVKELWFWILGVGSGRASSNKTPAWQFSHSLKLWLCDLCWWCPCIRVDGRQERPREGSGIVLLSTCCTRSRVPGLGTRERITPFLHTGLKADGLHSRLGLLLLVSGSQTRDVCQISFFFSCIGWEASVLSP